MADETPTAPAAPATPEQPALPKVTSASEWRRRAKALWLVTLPSGATVKAKRPDFARLVAQGVIDGNSFLTAPQNTPGDNYARLVPAARAAAPHIVIEPTISVPNGHTTATSEDVISVDDIQETDLITLFLWAGGWASTVPAVEVPA